MSASTKDGFVTIASYPEPLEANLIRSKLLSEDIECFLLDENIISVQPFYSNAIGGIKLQVHESDAKRAKLVIDESNKPPLHIVQNNDDNSKESDQDKPKLICPNCNSKEVYYERFSNAELVLCILLLGIPYFFISGNYHCYNCGNKWKKDT